MRPKLHMNSKIAPQYYYLFYLHYHWLTTALNAVAMKSRAIRALIVVTLIFNPVSGLRWRRPIRIRVSHSQLENAWVRPVTSSYFSKVSSSSLWKKRQTKVPTSIPTSAPTPTTLLPINVPESQVEDFRLGILKDLKGDNTRLSEGLTGTIIIRSGEKVAYSSPDATETESKLKYHWNTDDADIFAWPDGGYDYVSNSEIGKNRGGMESNLIVVGKSGITRRYVTEPIETVTVVVHRGIHVFRVKKRKEVKFWQVDPTGLRAANRSALGGRGWLFWSVCLWCT